MPLACSYRAAFGSCEPELIARDELDALRSAVSDALQVSEFRPKCSVEVWSARYCGKPVAGVVKMGEAGWMFACNEHVAEDDDAIRIVPEATARKIAEVTRQ